MGGWNSPSLVLLGDGTGSFPNQAVSPQGSYGDNFTTVLDSKVIDLNKDGNSDLILTTTKNYEESKIQILLGDGSGNFADSTNSFFIQGWKNNSWIKYIHLADLNRDGAPDLITELSDGSNSAIFLNDGDGKFFEPKNNKLNLGALEVADFNGDNFPDVVYWNGSNFYFAAGTGKFDLNLVGTTKNDVLQGDGFNNKLSGSAGNDTLRGGSGNDTLIGGLGNDLLNGGSGSDRFVFDTKLGATNVDTITDFGNGTDKIVLSKSIFNFAKSMVNKNGTLNSSASLSDYLLITGSGSTWFVAYDADGAGTKSQAVNFVDVTLTGQSNSLTVTDFLVL